MCAQVQAALAAAEAGSSQPPDLEQLLEQLVLDDGDLKPQELKVWTAEECGAGIDAGDAGANGLRRQERQDGNAVAPPFVLACASIPFPALL